MAASARRCLEAVGGEHRGRPLQGEVGATGCVERRSEGEVHEPRAREEAEEAQRSLSEDIQARRLCGGVRSWEDEHRREELADIDADKSDEEQPDGPVACLEED